MRLSIDRTQRFALVAAALFAFAAGYELWHLVAARRLGALTLAMTLVSALALSIVWGGAAALLVLRERLGDRMLRASFGLSAIGAFLVLAHGLVLRMLEQPIGIAFVLGGIVLAVLVKLAWTPFPWTAGDRPAAPPRIASCAAPRAKSTR